MFSKKYFVNPVSLFFVVFTFVIIQSTCSDAAPSNQNISHSNENGRGNHSTGTFYRGKHSKVGAAEAYYLALVSYELEYTPLIGLDSSTNCRYFL